MLSPERLSGIDGYVVLGQPVQEGRVKISYDDARQVKELVTSEYFELVTPSTINPSENVTKIKACKSVHDDVINGKEIILGPSIFGGAILRGETEQSWQLAVLMSSYKKQDPGSVSQRLESRYSFTVVDESLIKATKNIKIIRGIGKFSQMRMLPDINQVASDIRISDMEPNIEKIKFEKPIDPKDCARLAARLTGIMSKIRDNGQ